MDIEQNSSVNNGGVRFVKREVALSEGKEFGVSDRLASSISFVESKQSLEPSRQDSLSTNVALDARNVEMFTENSAYKYLIMRSIRMQQFAEEVIREYLKNPHSILYIGLIEFALNAYRRSMSGSFCDSFGKIF